MRRDCPACGSQRATPLFRTKVNADGVSEAPSLILACCDCGHRFTAELPTKDAQAALYGTAMYRRSGGRLSALLSAILDFQADRRLAAIEALSPPSRLVDVGCGKGRFIARAVRRRWTAIGADPIFTQLTAVTRGWPSPVFVSDPGALAFRTGSIDVVTGWHTLEHSAEPRRMIAEIWRVLRPGGLAVIEVPNIGSAQSLIGRSQWFQLDTPRHLSHFDPRTLRALLESMGFVIIGISTFSLELGVLGMYQTLLNLCGLPPSLFFWWLKNRRIPLSAGETVRYIGVAAALIGPATFAELLAAVTRNGGVIRIMARKPARKGD